MKLIRKFSIFLIICGLILAIKPLYDWLSFGGYPIIQFLIGIVCIIFGISILARKK